MRSTIARITLLLILILTPLFIVNRMNAQDVPGEVSALSAQDLHNLPVGVMLADDQLDLPLTVLCPVNFCVDVVAEAREASVDYQSMISTARASEPERQHLFSFADGVGNT